MRQNEFPEGWDQGKVKQVLAFYEGQTENEAVAEDEARVQSPEAAVLPIRICVVEPLVHPSPGTLARRLPDFGGFAIRAFDTVPDPLDVDALVLGKDLGDDFVDSQLFCHRLGRDAAVAGQHHDAHAFGV